MLCGNPYHLDPPYGCAALKENIAGEGDRRLCPVKGCDKTVPIRKQGELLRSDRFRCSRHDLFISRSVFYYEKLEQAVFHADDLNKRFNLDKRINKKGGKRETHRLGSCISEDALTWNIFRPLEDNPAAPAVFRELFDLPPAVHPFELIFWGNDGTGPWSRLQKARGFFGERTNRGTEPDLMILGDGHLVLIESKLSAYNKTGGWNESALKEREGRYQGGGDRWWRQVFAPESNFRTVSHEERFYELARMWLLGSWMADQSNCRFTLVSLTLPDREIDRLSQFRRHLASDGSRRFLHLTWRDVLTALSENQDEVFKWPVGLLQDLQLGYTGTGKLRRAAL